MSKGNQSDFFSRITGFENQGVLYDEGAYLLRICGINKDLDKNDLMVMAESVYLTGRDEQLMDEILKEQEKSQILQELNQQEDLFIKKHQQDVQKQHFIYRDFLDSSIFEKKKSGQTIKSIKKINNFLHK